MAEPVIATSTSYWKSDKRKEAAGKGQALPDGSYPIKDKRDWHKARQALGRAKDRGKVLAHLRKRAKALGIPESEYADLTAALVTTLRASAHGVVLDPLLAADDLNYNIQNFGIPSKSSRWDPSLHPRGRDGQFITTGGFVRGLMSWLVPRGNGFDQKRTNVDRAKVLGIRKQSSYDGAISKDPIIDVELVDPDDGKTYTGVAIPKNIEATSSTKAVLDDEEVDDLVGLDLESGLPPDDDDVGTMGLSRAVWQADFDKVRAALPEWAIVTFDDGTEGINPRGVNDDLLDLYRKLVQAGYANGFL